METRFKVIKEMKMEDLNRIVSEHIKDGWKPSGEMGTTTTSDGIQYFQQLKRVTV